jgi:hypothetical protein
VCLVIPIGQGLKVGVMNAPSNVVDIKTKLLVHERS